MNKLKGYEIVGIVAIIAIAVMIIAGFAAIVLSKDSPQLASQYEETLCAILDEGNLVDVPCKYQLIEDINGYDQYVILDLNSNNWTIYIELPYAQ